MHTYLHTHTHIQKFTHTYLHAYTGKDACKLTHSQCTGIVRQTATSSDSRTILAVTEDGSLWRWDVAVKP